MQKITLFLALLCLPVANSQSGQANSKLQNALKNVTDSISHIMATYHYNPAELASKDYQALEEQMQHLTTSAQSKEEFANAYNALWNNGPFSHVSLALSNQKAADMAAYFDALRVGEQGMSIQFQDNTAILTVNTMMGVDTYERIYQAYQQIAEHGAKALVIDVRHNAGGAFAIVPLVSHIISQPVTAGFFASSKWWGANTRVPTTKDIASLAPWQGWTLASFWRDVQDQPLTRIQFTPMEPRFQGPVYVLVSNSSASATEFAVDALANETQVTIIGETTAGEMLSQKMFDLPHGFQLALPIAEYYSTRIGRIEGKGVAPDIVIDQNMAMEVAMQMIGGKTAKAAVKKARLAVASKDVPIFGEEKLYLFGTMNDWGKKWNSTPHFSYEGQGRYMASTTLEAGTYELKFAPMSWAFDYGAYPDQEPLPIGETIALVKVAGSKNLELHVTGRANFRFLLDVSDQDNATIMVVKE